MVGDTERQMNKLVLCPNIGENRCIDALVGVTAYIIFTLLRRLRWLMQGNKVEREEVSPEIDLQIQQSSYPVSTMMDAEFEAEDGRIITCLIAVSMHMHGFVSLVSGGFNHTSVKVRYTTEEGLPDVFLFYVQSARRIPVLLKKDVAKKNRYALVYDPIKNWTLKEMRAAFLHNGGK